MWRYFRNMTLPESLQEKISAWLSRGHLIRYEFGVFLPPSWIAVMLGQNLIPNGYDARVDRLPADALTQGAETMRSRIKASIERAPDHAAYIGQSGFASKTSPLVAGVGR
jgi:tryptophan halogenase